MPAKRSGAKAQRGGSRSKRLLHTVLVQAIRPSAQAWETHIAKIFRRHRETNDGGSEAPKLTILLRGWPHANATQVASVLRDQLLANTKMLPIDDSIGIDYFGYHDNPYPEYRSWLEIDLLTHPELPARTAGVTWGWTMDNALRLIGRLAAKPKVMVPENDDIARGAARKWGLRVTAWSDEQRTKLHTREPRLTQDR